LNLCSLRRLVCLLQVQSWLSSLCRGVGAAAWGAVSQADTAALALARRVLLPLPAAGVQVFAPRYCPCCCKTKRW
jgi:hypothetical protein